MYIGRRELTIALLVAFLPFGPVSLREVFASSSQETAADAPGAVPTFSREIAPIIYRNCSPCHRPGGIGPFSLLTFDDVRRHAHQIEAVTRSRYMPPWLPQPGYGHFADERRLTDAEITTIAKWVSAGAPEGDGSPAPTHPEWVDGWQLGSPDLVLKAPRAFALPASGPDLFWNFVLRPDLPAGRYVRAIEIRPGSSGNVHHANLLIDRTGSTQRLERSPGAGFAGMDLTIDRNPFDPESHFLFWKPGSIPTSEPDGLSWRLDPGNLLVLNTHLQPSGKAEQVQPIVGLYFTDKAATRFPILIELQNDEALRIRPGNADFVVTDDFKLPVSADVLAIYPHAHYLGKLLEAYADLPDGSRCWLIRIPDWNLNWQAVYRYADPVFLPAGTTIHMRFHYDNSRANPRNPHSPPQLVVAGNNAADEMGHLWLQLLPRGRGDQRRLIEQAMAEHRLERNPEDVTALVNLGAIQLSRLEAQKAVTTLSRAVHLDPRRPESHDMLGMAFRSVGRAEEARQQFELALRDDPQYLNARFNLATSYAKQQDFGKAADYFQPIAASYPKVASVQRQYGQLLMQAGRKNEATAVLQRAVILDQFASKN